MDPLLEPPAADVRAVVERALAEDLTPLGDITSMLLDPTLQATGRFVARGPGTIAGSACVRETFHQVDPTVALNWSAPDGTSVESGAELGTVTGPLATMLTAERTALNLLGHLSGIATAAAHLRAEADASTRVWDTRKTTPGLRSLEKAAVRAGGCVNHRGNLSEWVMLKDNHLTGTTIAHAVSRARAAWPGRTVQVECDRADQVAEAIAARVDAVLLDNLSVDEAARCVRLVRDGLPGCLVEISGGIDLETIGAYSRIGADCISVGAMTNSAPVLDIGLDITPSREGAAGC